jgi:hypothetical protein
MIREICMLERDKEREREREREVRGEVRSKLGTATRNFFSSKRDGERYG